MELPRSEEGEIPLPINSTYGGVHIIHHHHHNNTIPSSAPQIPNNNGPLDGSIHDHPNPKKTVRYRECLKNHAASMGGNATDGCGEFMPSGEENATEALTCSACNCHRNFHRKELRGEEYPPHRHISNSPSPFDCYFNGSRKLNMASECDEQEDGFGVVIARPKNQVLKKRVRTKFSVEQKERMLRFAEEVGWKIQKLDESVVQLFCQEIGVKRRVLKVWMHNNKHHLTNKMISTETPTH